MAIDFTDAVIKPSTNKILWQVELTNGHIYRYNTPSRIWVCLRPGPLTVDTATAEELTVWLKAQPQYQPPAWAE